MLNKGIEKKEPTFIRVFLEKADGTSVQVLLSQVDPSNRQAFQELSKILANMKKN